MREHIQISQEFISKLIDGSKKFGGISADIKNKSILSPFNAWCYPKYPSKTKIISSTNLRRELIRFINENSSSLKEKDCFLGVWLNPQINKFYLDIATRDVDLDRAIKAARALSLKDNRKIVSIYNPYLDKTIYF